MRRLLPLLVLTLVLAGCGDDSSGTASRGLDPDDPALNGSRNVPPPTPTAAPAQPVAAGMAARLRRGEVAVFDLGGRTRIRPGTLDVSKTETVEDLDWKRWDATGAVGTGRMETNTCDPTCAFGAKVRQSVTVSLSGVRDCDGRRYFGRSDVEASKPGYRVVPYLTAPC